MTPATGYEWAKERVDSLPGHLRDQLEASLPDLPVDLKAKGVVATGVGSSEAAARYLVALLNRIGIPAEYLPLSSFYGPLKFPEGKFPYLAVFSQGLSPNSGIVLKQRGLFAGTLFFTSSTPEGQRAAGKEDRAEWLEKLAGEGVSIILHPMQNEYEILPRFVGPLCVMLAVCLVIEKLEPGSLGGVDLLQTLPQIIEEINLSENEKEDWISELVPGLQFWFTHSGSQYSQNLSCKLLEALFIPAPSLGDILSYSHGPFQRNCKASGPNWIFTSGERVEKELLQKLRPLFDRGGSCRVIESPLPAPLEIFYYEAFLNKLLMQALERSDLDLVNWPGKGRDGKGYQIDAPGAYS